MRISYLISLLLLTGIFSCSKNNSSSGSGEWKLLTTPDMGEPQDIKFANPNVGYVLGLHSADDSIYNILLKTTDGGSSWTRIAYLDHSFLLNTSGGVMSTISVSPFDPNIVYAGRQNLIRSNNSGNTWNLLDTVKKLAAPTIAFLDPATEVCIGRGFACISTDGGITWDSTYYPQTFINFSLLQFTSTQTGFLGGGITFDGNSAGLLAKTSDAGRSWQTINYPFGDIVSFSFTEDNSGYVSTVTDSGDFSISRLTSKLIKTSDAGKNWEEISQVSNPNSSDPWNHLYFYNTNNGFASTSTGIYRTADGGHNWQKDATLQVMGLCFPDNHTGYAITNDGRLYKRVF